MSLKLININRLRSLLTIVLFSLAAHADAVDPLPPIGTIVTKYPYVETRYTQGFLPIVVDNEFFYICTPLTGGVQIDSEVGIEIDKGMFEWTELKNLIPWSEEDDELRKSPEMRHAVPPLTFFPLHSRLPEDESAQKVWIAIRARAIDLRKVSGESKITTVEQVDYMPRIDGKPKDVLLVRRIVEINAQAQRQLPGEEHSFFEINDETRFAENGSIFFSVPQSDTEASKGVFVGMAITNFNRENRKSRIAFIHAITILKLFNDKMVESPIR